jgi:Methyltransferase domain
MKQSTTSSVSTGTWFPDTMMTGTIGIRRFISVAKGFRGLQRMGVNVTPNHYYWPVPDLAELEKREWPIYSSPPGCQFDLKKQAELARELSSNYGPECCFSPEPHESSYHYNNGYFEAVDAEIAYFMVRHFKPARIVEIGTGYSTRVLATALQKNSERDALQGQLISIDPNPERFLRNGWRSFVVQLLRVIQEVELEFFDTLQSGDILFIDSSHVVSVGSDVLREYLQNPPPAQARSSGPHSRYLSSFRLSSPRRAEQPLVLVRAIPAASISQLQLAVRSPLGLERDADSLPVGAGAVLPALAT